MTYEELNSLFYLRKRIEYLRRRIDELSNEDGLNGISYTGISTGLGVSSPVERIAIKRTALINEYNEAIEQALSKEQEICAFIENTKDAEIKFIMQKRFLQFMTYEKIANEIHSDRTSVSKKLGRYLKKSR
ncbi:MAG: hypothetical protein MR019_04330 [Ruminococcus sp.]|nr:hypothetical protein [Ruminococcus sp.]MDY3896206.1 hypothetical protein [Candidatus Fimenecus sp.]